MPLFVGARIYRDSGYGSHHPLAIPRVPTVTDLCRAMGWLPGEAYRSSPRAKAVALTTFHTPNYIEALQRAEREQAVSDRVRRRHGIGTLSNPVYPLMFSRPATSVGGVLLATGLIAKGGTVYVPGGGTHHGMPDRANGFCYVNDPVLAIQSLQRMGIGRIAYVDIDAHHCDGVEHALPALGGVRMISVHEENRWPFTGKLDDTGGGAAFNLPVPRGLNDTEYGLILDRFILPAVADYKPDAIILQCGADAVLEDPLSRLALSNGSHWKTVAALRPLAPRYLVLGGGGYNPWSVARLWAGVWATLCDHDIPDALPTPARPVLATLTWARSRGRQAPEHWITTLKDPWRHGPIRGVVRDRVAHLRRRFAAGP
ncbi:acetoin utilization protein AcuC [Sedimentitalea xiamensis]|nr:acetoin utilization protein AcuC [Sedimentitalea xiamensis]